MKNLIDAIEDKKAPEESAGTDKKKEKDIKAADVDLEAGKKSGEAMQGFFAEVEEVKKVIEFVKGQTKQVVQLSDKAVKAIGQDLEKECSDKLDSIIKVSNVQTKKAKQLLTKMKDDMEKPVKGKKIKSSELRIRRNLHQTLTQKFVQVLREYQQTQQMYKTKMKEKVARQVRVVKPDATYDEIDQALRSGDHGAVYRVAILQPTADPVSEAYLNVRDKYQDVLNLERSIVELHQMFVDMAVLVASQGEMLDKIEYSVNAAEDFVAQGNVELKKALVARKQIRRKYFCLLIVCIIIAVAIIVPLILRFLPQ